MRPLLRALVIVGVAALAMAFRADGATPGCEKRDARTGQIRCVAVAPGFSCAAVGLRPCTIPSPPEPTPTKPPAPGPTPTPRPVPTQPPLIGTMYVIECATFGVMADGSVNCNGKTLAVRCAPNAAPIVIKAKF